MQINDVIPDLPEIKDSELNIYDLSFAVKELEQAQNMFILYENSEGEIRLFFNKLSAPLYACIVAKLSQANQQKVYEFLKLALEGVRLSKNGTKKSYTMNLKIEKHIKANI